MEPIDRSKPVLITGGSGYIAGWIINDLLEAGVTVRATVRDVNQEIKVNHLNQMAAKFPNKLELVSADLLEPGSFDQAVHGCELVLHTASPFLIKSVPPCDGSLPIQLNHCQKAGMRCNYIMCSGPFDREPGFGEVSVNFDLKALLRQGERIPLRFRFNPVARMIGKRSLCRWV